MRKTAQPIPEWTKEKSPPGVLMKKSLAATHASLEVPTRLHVRVSKAFLQQLDDWRRQQEDLPSRTEAVRRIVALVAGQPKKSA
jgi:hypothetical protein